jgi:hypothetical protein
MPRREAVSPVPPSPWAHRNTRLGGAIDLSRAVAWHLPSSHCRDSVHLASPTLAFSSYNSPRRRWVLGLYGGCGEVENQGAPIPQAPQAGV